MMHELSIALSLVELVCNEAKRLGSVRIHALHVDVGALSGVATEALEFAFEAAAQGTAVAGARLEVHEVPITVWCQACHAAHVLSRLQPRQCPVCLALTPELRAGDELVLRAIEIEDVHAHS